MGAAVTLASSKRQPLDPASRAFYGMEPTVWLLYRRLRMLGKLVSADGDPEFDDDDRAALGELLDQSASELLAAWNEGLAKVETSNG
jgi:hypothetical protein